jgi:hypothetical protein
MASGSRSPSANSRANELGAVPVVGDGPPEGGRSAATSHSGLPPLWLVSMWSIFAPNVWIGEFAELTPRTGATAGWLYDPLASSS